MRRSPRRFVAVALFAAASAALPQSAVYKLKERDGRTVYTDVAPPRMQPNDALTNSTPVRLLSGFRKFLA